MQEHIKEFIKKYCHSPLQLVIVGLAFLVMAGSFAKALHYTKAYGGSDLKRRIIGARTLDTNFPVYQYNWKPGDDTRYFTTNDPQPKGLNGLSVPPSILYFLYPLSKFSYIHIKFIWTFLLMGFFFGTVFFIVKSMQKQLQPEQLLQIAVATVLAFCSVTWLVNIERAQIYILYAFLFAVLFYSYQRQTTASLISFGILFAISAWLRPYFAILFIPLLFTKNKTAIISTIAAGAVLLVITYLQKDLWIDYFKAMERYVTYNAVTVDYPLGTLSGYVDGINTYDKVKVDWLASGIQSAGYIIFNKYSLYIPTMVYNLFVALSAVAISNYFKNLPKQYFLLVGFVCYLMFEIIVPAQRGNYNVIQWLFAIIALLAVEQHVSKHQQILLIIGFCLIQSWPFHFPQFAGLGELLLIFVVLNQLRIARNRFLLEAKGY
jgi:hypothetical protein